MRVEPLRVRLQRALEARGLDRWKDDVSRCRMTRDEFLDIMTELIAHDTEVRARQMDVEAELRRRREGAVKAVLAIQDAGLLNRKGAELVRDWRDRSAEGLVPDLSCGAAVIVPS